MKSSTDKCSCGHKIHFGKCKEIAIVKLDGLVSEECSCENNKL